MPFSDVSMAE